MSHFKVCILLYIMKRLLFSLLIVLFGSLLYAAEPDSVFVSSSNPIDKETCTYKGKKLYGNVRIVDCGADFDVRIVECGADLEVKVEEYSAYRCGEWHFVNAGEDFTVRFVDGCADFDIRFVNSAPSVR